MEYITLSELSQSTDSELHRLHLLFNQKSLFYENRLTAMVDSRGYETFSQIVENIPRNQSKMVGYQLTTIYEKHKKGDALPNDLCSILDQLWETTRENRVKSAIRLNAQQNAADIINSRYSFSTKIVCPQSERLGADSDPYFAIYHGIQAYHCRERKWNLMRIEPEIAQNEQKVVRTSVVLGTIRSMFAQFLGGRTGFMYRGSFVEMPFRQMISYTMDHFLKPEEMQKKLSEPFHENKMGTHFFEELDDIVQPLLAPQ